MQAITPSDESERRKADGKIFRLGEPHRKAAPERPTKGNIQGNPQSGGDMLSPDWIFAWRLQEAYTLTDNDVAALWEEMRQQGHLQLHDEWMKAIARATQITLNKYGLPTDEIKRKDWTEKCNDESLSIFCKRLEESQHFFQNNIFLTKTSLCDAIDSIYKDMSLLHKGTHNKIMHEVSSAIYEERYHSNAIKFDNYVYRPVTTPSALNEIFGEETIVQGDQDPWNGRDPFKQLICDSFAFHKRAAVVYLQKCGCSMIQEVKGLSRTVVDSILAPAGPTIPPVQPPEESAILATPPNEAVGDLPEGNMEQHGIHVPRTLWEGKRPSVVRDRMREAGYDDFVIAYALYTWCEQNDQSIGRLLPTPREVDSDRGNSDSACRRRSQTLREKASPFNILTDQKT